MARVEEKESWVAAGNLDGVRASLRRFLKRHELRVTQESAREIRASQGSQFWTRFLGGWFVSPATLPKQVTIRLRPFGDGVWLSVTIEESLGFGVMDPLLKDRYAAYFDSWLDDLRDEIPEES